MLLLSLVAALTIHGDLCSRAHDVAHHQSLDGPSIDQRDDHGHDGSYHCRVDHEYSPSAVAERPGRTPRHTHPDVDWPHLAASAWQASTADVEQAIPPLPRRPESRSGRDVLATVCVSRT